jgi:hypothetical protein
MSAMKFHGVLLWIAGSAERLDCAAVSVAADLMTHAVCRRASGGALRLLAESMDLHSDSLDFAMILEP